MRADDATAPKVYRAIAEFGAPVDGLNVSDLAQPGIVFQIGVSPVRIDILTEIDSVSFDDAWPNRIAVNWDGLEIPVIGRSDLIRNKRSTGRTKDLADAEQLEQEASNSQNWQNKWVETEVAMARFRMDATWGVEEQQICDTLATTIYELLPEAESKIWHRHPAWFLDGNPIVGYSKLKAGIRLMFWSGASFDEDKLSPGTGKFRDASMIFTDSGQINLKDMKRWIKKARTIQWDYKNVARRKGKLVRLK